MSDAAEDNSRRLTVDGGMLGPGGHVAEVRYNRELVIWRDGVMIRETPAVDPRAVSWGVFTTAGCDHGEPLLWPLHERRLRHSLQHLGAAPGTGLPDEVALRKLLQDNGLTGPARLRVVVHQAANSGQWSVEATACEIAAPGPKASPLALEIVHWPAPPPLIGHKTLARLPWDLARETARSVGADDALLVTDDGLVLETAVANIWARFGGTVVTPPAPRCCLPGIMRAWIERALPQLGLRREARSLGVHELRTADEVFLSNAVTGPRPVRRIGTQQWTTRETIDRLASRGVPAPGWRSAIAAGHACEASTPRRYNGVGCAVALEKPRA